MHVFLDLDGTLVDPKIGITRSVAYALERVGKPVQNPDSLTWMIGPALIDSFRELGVADPQRALDLYRERYIRVGLFECHVYAGILDAMQQMRNRGWQMHLATAKPHSYASKITRNFGLAPFFENEFGPELDGTRNNKGELLQYALQVTGINVADAVMIGDRIYDVEAALHVGMRAVGVTWGYGSADEIGQADRLCSQPADLVGVLADLN